jgi:hypothetical protein
MTKRLLVLLLAAAFLGPVALAAARTWKSADGRFSTEAELIGLEDGKAQLKKTDGKVVQVPLRSLSAADQEYVHKRYPETAGRSGEEDESEPADKPSAAKAVEGIAAQDIAMKLIRLDPPKRKSRAKPGTLADYILHLTQPQQFIQRGKGGPAEAEFHRLVKKEPKYIAPIPFRGVVNLGGHQFGFALDATGPKAAGYDKLYFDTNGNGDLTDDRPEKAIEVTQPGPKMWQAQFPAVTVTLDTGDEPLEYAFLMSVLCTEAGDNSYATVSLYSAVAREGFLIQGKRRVKVVLVDRNSNGRFDDVVSIQPGGNVAEGDLLLINPNPKKALAAGGNSPDRSLVSKVLSVGKSCYRMEVARDGSKLKLTPMQMALGSVAGPGPSYRAVLTSDDYGVVVLNGVKDQKIALAEGTWKVVNYTLDATVGSGGRTAIEATFAGEPPAMTVRKGETARLPFGGAFHAAVTAARVEKSKVSLQLAIVGPSGEQCKNISLNGGKPPKPHFLIKDQDDKIIQQGDFEYG